MANNSHASEKVGVSYGQPPVGSNHINPRILGEVRKSWTPGGEQSNFTVS